MASAPRRATFQHGLDLDNSVKQSFNEYGLAAWVPKYPERPPTDDLRDDELEVPLCVLVADE